MALQSSGAISLNDIHVEAGGSSGTSASINDSDIRGLIGKSSGATMSFSEWYGASNVAIRTAWNPSNITRNKTSEGGDFYTVFAGMKLYRNGEGGAISSFYFGNGGSPQDFVSSTYQWLTATGSTNGDGFQVYVTYSSYSVSSGTGTIQGSYNSWLTMNTNRSWYVTHYGDRNGHTEMDIRFRFRPTGGSTVLDRTFNIRAETEN
jgi:hypothetical protein